MLQHARLFGAVKCSMDVIVYFVVVEILRLFGPICALFSF